MTDLTISVLFTKTGASGAGEPATGLTLSEIEIDLVAQNRATGAETVIWTAVNPTAELSTVGRYIRIYSGADLDTYNYYAHAYYSGVTSLDQAHVNGAIGIAYIPLGTAKEWTYIVQTAGGVPIEGVYIEVHTNAAMTNAIWNGYTDSSGQPLDQFDNKPRFDAGTYYIYRRKPSYHFDNPDTEVIS